MMQRFSLHLFDKLRVWLRRYFFGPHSPFADPPIGVRHPRGRRPGGRSSAVALLEPDDDRGLVDAIATRQLRRP
jgi:hypothetical protein